MVHKGGGEGPSRQHAFIFPIGTPALARTRKGRRVKKGEKKKKQHRAQLGVIRCGGNRTQRVKKKGKEGKKASPPLKQNIAYSYAGEEKKKKGRKRKRGGRGRRTPAAGAIAAVKLAQRPGPKKEKEGKEEEALIGHVVRICPGLLDPWNHPYDRIRKRESISILGRRKKTARGAFPVETGGKKEKNRSNTPVRCEMTRLRKRGKGVEREEALSFCSYLLRKEREGSRRSRPVKSRQIMGRKGKRGGDSCPISSPHPHVCNRHFSNAREGEEKGAGGRGGKRGKRGSLPHATPLSIECGGEKQRERGERERGEKRVPSSLLCVGANIRFRQRRRGGERGKRERKKGELTKTARAFEKFLCRH